jgi:nucleoside-diphosphate-sugar epimerase
MDVKSVLVVGCGYIGLPLARLAKTAGRQVFTTTRKRERFAALAEIGFTPIRWDVTEMSGELNDHIKSADSKNRLTRMGDLIAKSKYPLPEVDVVVYSVGFDRSLGKPIEEVFSAGLFFTLAALPGKPKVVYASSTGVYGDARGALIDEHALPEPTDPSGQACLNAEKMLHTIADVQGLDYCILRFAGIYGAGRLLNAEPLKKGEPIPADGAAWINLIHQDDAAMALWKAVLYGESGEVYNIADGHPVRRQEFYLKLAELLKAPPPKFAPEWARRHRGNRRINADKARWKLGWSPQYPSYIEGLEAIVREENPPGQP